VNPSSMPKRSGDRIKTDRRDGDALARLHRAGEVTPIYIPTADDEALRDPGRAGWTKSDRRWLTSVSRSPRSTSPCRRIATRSTKPSGASSGSPTSSGSSHPRGAGRRSSMPSKVLRGFSFVTAVGLVGGGRRHSTLHASPRADGVSRPRAVGVFQRPECSPGRDHQGGQSPRPTIARRSGVGVSRRAAHRPADAVSTRETAEAHLRHRLERPTPTHVAISENWSHGAQPNPKSRPLSPGS
jgi:hypothetical protein